MEGRIEIINGKPRKVYTRQFGDVVRIGIEFPVEDFSHAEKKAQLFSKNFTDLQRELVKGFNKSMGFGKQDIKIKDAGSLFDNRLSRHIVTAVHRALEEIAECPVNINEN